ncbi:hypothetical protein BCR32DRAFT_249317 [Anaeromyces robustus]|uniref:Uncharacterized protein n=1 Tax=Anaeromyces robustus TaxID=1754192 RepID=A0A1Y1WQC5_9FUNG|nr:hypothetical protein BCR32DRAFT_249317 [Anaeromyces robustus]|eukprot:ORX75747.1 hypothetical protein BCR32DRAFT_249317 [Anaeromyces robustus]
MCEEKKLNNELKYWFGENFINSNSLHTEEAKKIYRDCILNTFKLLNDFLRMLIPDFNLNNVSDKCLKTYENYIGNYDKYLDEYDNYIFYIKNNNITIIKDEGIQSNFIFTYERNKNNKNKNLNITNIQYISLSNYFQYPYSSSSILLSSILPSSSSTSYVVSNPTPNRNYNIINEFHEYLVLNEKEQNDLIQTLDTILKLESIKNQKISLVLNKVKNEEKIFPGFCKRKFYENSLKIIRPEHLEKYISKPSETHIQNTRHDLECIFKEIRIKEIQYKKIKKINDLLRNNIHYQNIFIDAYQRYDFLHSFWMEIIFKNWLVKLD